MTHNIFTDLLGAITLPLFIMLILGLMAGVKPDTICRGYCSIVGAILGGVLKFTLGIMSAGIRELIKIRSKAKTYAPYDGYGKVKVKVYAKED